MDYRLADLADQGSGIIAVPDAFYPVHRAHVSRANPSQNVLLRAKIGEQQGVSEVFPFAHQNKGVDSHGLCSLMFRSSVLKAFKIYSGG